MALSSPNQYDPQDILELFPELIREAIYANMPEECRPVECDKGCLTTWFCDTETAWPTSDDPTTAGIVVTAQDYEDRVARTNCVSTHAQTFHIRFFAACWPTEDISCVSDVVKQVQRCLWPFRCAIRKIQGTQLGLPDGCDPVEFASRIECFNVGGASGWETTITVPF